MTHQLAYSGKEQTLSKALPQKSVGYNFVTINVSDSISLIRKKRIYRHKIKQSFSTTSLKVFKE